MSYKQEITDYQNNAITYFEKHLKDLENNAIASNTNEEDAKPASQIYVDYQNNTVKLIERKLQIDNEFLKEISISNLQKFQGLETEKFEQIQMKIVDNHRRIISELKQEYEQMAEQSREHVKSKLTETRVVSDLKEEPKDPSDFFPKKKRVLTLNLALTVILFALVVAAGYFYILKG